MPMTSRQLLEKLVSFPTVSAESNLALMDFVADYLAGFGVESHRVHDGSGTKANLFANIGPAVEGGVVLSGHTDVVPVAGQDWTQDPFTLCERDGRLYGRGSCDMKGFVALALAAVPLALKGRIRRPLQIALSHDEEVGCLGAPAMIAEMTSRLPRAQAVIVGEPSMMKVVTGHKGGIGIATHLRGYEVHSSLQPEGVSAIHEAARLIEWANAMNDANRAAPPDAEAAVFDPPFTTVHVGRIEGGTADNITARDCRFVMGMRYLPGESAEDWQDAYRTRAAEVERAMQAVRPETAITLERCFDVPGLRPEPGGAAEALVRGLTGDNSQNVVSYGTEAGQFQQAGYSTVICGPGSITEAHQADEYVSCAQFAAGETFMRRLVESLERD